MAFKYSLEGEGVLGLSVGRAFQVKRTVVQDPE